MNTPTLTALTNAVNIRRQISVLETKLANLLDGSSNGAEPQKKTRKPMSRKTRAKLAAIQRKRWAKYRAAKK